MASDHNTDSNDYTDFGDGSWALPDLPAQAEPCSSASLDGPYWGSNTTTIAKESEYPGYMTAETIAVYDEPSLSHDPSTAMMTGTVGLGMPTRLDQLQPNTGDSDNEFIDAEGNPVQFIRTEMTTQGVVVPSTTPYLDRTTASLEASDIAFVDVDGNPVRFHDEDNPIQVGNTGSANVHSSFPAFQGGHASDVTSTATSHSSTKRSNDKATRKSSGGSRVTKRQGPKKKATEASSSAGTAVSDPRNPDWRSYGELEPLLNAMLENLEFTMFVRRDLSPPETQRAIRNKATGQTVTYADYCYAFKGSEQNVPQLPTVDYTTKCTARLRDKAHLRTPDGDAAQTKKQLGLLNNAILSCCERTETSLSVSDLAHLTEAFVRREFGKGKDHAGLNLKVVKPHAKPHDV